MSKVREKLRDSNIKLTDLAIYLEMSRPTLYSLLLQYESKDKNKMEKRIYDLFYFIEKTKNINSVILIDYLLNEKKNSSMDLELKELIRSIENLYNSEDIRDKEKIKSILEILMKK